MPAVHLVRRVKPAFWITDDRAEFLIRVVKEYPWRHLQSPEVYLRFPFASFANSSITGMAVLHVGHHGAQAKTMAGSGDFIISSSKLASDTIKGCSANIAPTLSRAPHFPHFASRSVRSGATRFLLLHSVQRRINGSGFVSNSPHFPHFARASLLFLGIRFFVPHRLHWTIWLFVWSMLLTSSSILSWDARLC